MGRGTRLLVVEDDPELAEMLTAPLAGEGYAVELAGDGQRGLHLGLTRWVAPICGRGKSGEVAERAAFKPRLISASAAVVTAFLTVLFGIAAGLLWQVFA